MASFTRGANSPCPPRQGSLGSGRRSSMVAGLPDISKGIMSSETDLMELFPHVFTFTSLLLFVGPVVKTFQLATQPTVWHLVGSLPVDVGLSVAVMVVSAHLVHRLLRRASKVAIALGLLLPSLAMLVLANDLNKRAVVWNTQLAAEDCRPPSSKWDVERSWMVARDFYSQCAVPHRPGSSSRVKNPLIGECQGYDEAAKVNPLWHLLESSETKYGCGGWCTPAQPMWTARQGPIDACTDVLASQLAGEAIPAARQLYALSLMVFAGTSFLFVLFGPAMNARGIKW